MVKIIKDFKGKKIIVSLDSHGFAKKVIEKIKKKKGEVITIGGKGADLKPDFEMDLTDVKATEQRVEEFKEKYPEVNGFIHLASLDYYFDKDVDRKYSDESLNTTIKAVFLLIKSLFDKFDQKHHGAA